ncbi:MAG TPA: benzoyl-CoA-dihydrodiol lyase, partial [Casimicrobiaceae bacterium]|nr:benzoyl-CoA-dihydrodiol lyase [Casimicrobiaceae bacterium]
SASDRPADAVGVALPRIGRTDDAGGYHYAFIDAAIDRARRVATLTVRAPASVPPQDIGGIEAAGAAWWPLQMARELDDVILTLRTNELDIGTWLLRTEGDAAHVLAVDRTLRALGNHWFVRETLGLLRRTLARLDVSSRTLIALIEPGSCFAGTLFELALAADRSYIAALPDEPSHEPTIVVGELNDGAYPMVNGWPRLSQRFYGEAAPLKAVREVFGQALSPGDAVRLGLVTAAPDDIDWTDEIRIALEERASLSPDALTGLEANLRFGERETMETRIFGRLSAWQNWIFIRPNAVGEAGALKVYGKGERAQFDFTRV